LAAERAQLEALRQTPQIQEPDKTLAELRQARREALEIGDYDSFDELDQQIDQYRNQAVDTNTIVQQVTAQTKQQIDYDNALNQFVSRNNLIVNDNVLYNIAMKTFENQCANSATYQEAFSKTEQAMNEWIGKLAPGAAQVDKSMTERVEKKKTIPSEPGRLSVKSAPPSATKEETASEIIANMRRSRGLPV